MALCCPFYVQKRFPFLTPWHPIRALAKERRQNLAWALAFLFPISPRFYVTWMKGLCADWTCCVALFKWTAFLSSLAMRNLLGAWTWFSSETEEEQCWCSGHMERCWITGTPGTALLWVTQAPCSRKPSHRWVVFFISFAWTQMRKSGEVERGDACPVQALSLLPVFR